jgi:predicted amidohydrolase
MKLRLLTKKSNLEKARKLTREAAAKGAKLVVLPAFVNTAPFYLYYSMQRNKVIAKNQAERVPSMTSEYLSMIAAESGVYLVAGPIIERAGPRLFLTTLIISPTGEIISKYRKMVINGVDRELGISAGRTPFVLDQLGRSMGIMAEDDLYYPEVARTLVMMGATALVTSLRIGDPVDKIRLMLLARSMENHVPILAVGGALETPDKYYETPTMVVDPEKGIVDEVKDTEDTFVLVEMVERPDNLREIYEETLRTKTLASALCRAARENIVEDLLGKLNREGGATL